MLFRSVNETAFVSASLAILQKVLRDSCELLVLNEIPCFKASDSRDRTPLWKERFHAKETAWLIYGLGLAVLEKNMRPASKVLIALRNASERTTSPRRCCGVLSRLPSAFVFGCECKAPDAFCGRSAAKRKRHRQPLEPDVYARLCDPCKATYLPSGCKGNNNLDRDKARN